MLQEGPDSTVILQDKQEIQILENLSTEMTISVSASFLTTIEWSFFGTDYIFPITHWRTTAINTLVKRFHLLPRDPLQYGQVTEDNEGNITQSVDSHQKANIALQAAKDVMNTLGKILKIHGRAVLEYAIWYRQNHEGSQTYSEYITRVTGHQIAHTNFMAPNVQ
ncbi:TPA: hypothetical protein ACH3X1_004757 [Trebouxia sp. C0004]